MISKIKTLLRLRSYRKVSNFLINNLERSQKREVLKSFPCFATMNITNLCNKRCKFCEIHYFYKKAEDGVFPNNLTTDLLKNHQWLKYLISMELSGATGEPFVNPHIMEVIEYLKNLNIRLSANTNGTLIDERMASQLIASQFDSLLVAIHGDRKAYSYLQGGDLDHLLAGVGALIKERNFLASSYPLVGVEFSLNRLNADSVKGLMKRVNDIGVDPFIMKHYYDCRNILKSDISFYFDTETCNVILRDAYEYASEIGLRMVPSTPPFLGDMKGTTQGYCKDPWERIKFKGCVEYDHSEYISVCNRIILLRIDYDKFHDSFADYIWNSGVLRFLRRTVNTKQSNSICRFCRDPEIGRIRCLDNVEYSHRRDNAIEDFFNEFSRSGIEYREAEGLTLLAENPYKYDEKDGF